jgi:hypothetical protein
LSPWVYANAAAVPPIRSTTTIAARRFKPRRF